MKTQKYWLTKRYTALAIEWNWQRIAGLKKRAASAEPAKAAKLDAAAAVRRYRAHQLERYYEVLAGIRGTDDRWAAGAGSRG